MELEQKSIKLIPYGIMNFQNLREDNSYFLDKTRLLPKLEEAGKFLFLIRPRRMGKSLWLSMMEYYYDISCKDDFDRLFQDTWIQQNPTKDRSSFLILRFDFSDVCPLPDQVEEDFDRNGRDDIKSFCRKYQEELGAELISDIQEHTKFTAQLRVLLRGIVAQGLKLYLFIDEYDNFCNTILSTSGSEQYQAIVSGEGFYRHFFNILKGGAMKSGSGMIKLFITGVSPITMDDVTSGFNIGTNISLKPTFNEMLGFTEEELIEILQYYIENKRLTLSMEEMLPTMKEWYNHYRFSEFSETRLFNTDMVLFFIKEVIEYRRIPKELIDHNVRIDYGKLRHLITIDQKLNGNFNLLRTVLEEGEVEADVSTSFPLKKLTDSNNFHSLLYYFGLLTFREGKEGYTVLGIPNQTVRQLMFGYIRDALDDTDCFRLNLRELSVLIRQMAFDGNWEPVFEFLAQEIKNQTKIRDYLSGEKTIQGFLAAYLSMTNYYIFASESELNKGYADFLLESSIHRYPEARYSCLVEVKYISRSNDAKKGEKKAKKSEEEAKKILKKKIKEAKEQIKSYEQDPNLRERIKPENLLKLVLVFKGWELIHKEQLP